MESDWLIGILLFVFWLAMIAYMLGFALAYLWRRRSGETKEDLKPNADSPYAKYVRDAVGVTKERGESK